MAKKGGVIIMKKRATLNAAALASVAGAPANPVTQLETTRAAARIGQQRSRVGKVQVQGYFPPETRQRLKILAASSGRTVEELLSEAIDDLLAKHGVI